MLHTWFGNNLSALISSRRPAILDWYFTLHINFGFFYNIVKLLHWSENTPPGNLPLYTTNYTL